PAERRHGAARRDGDAHRAALRHRRPESLTLADPLLRHSAGPLLLGRRHLDGWREDLDAVVVADRGSAHRAAPAHGPARSRETGPLASAGHDRHAAAPPPLFAPAISRLPQGLPAATARRLGG